MLGPKFYPRVSGVRICFQYIEEHFYTLLYRQTTHTHTHAHPQPPTPYTHTHTHTPRRRYISLQSACATRFPNSFFLSVSNNFGWDPDFCGPKCIAFCSKFVGKFFVRRCKKFLS